MADAKITQLTAYNPPIATDVIPIVDVSTTTTKKITMDNVRTYVSSSTCGVAASPTASQTDTITHGLGRIPIIIRIYGIGTFTSNASATATTFSIGLWNATGNRSVAQPYNTAAITTTQASTTSTTFAVNIQTGANSFITGVIGNVGATTFDIVWTETGTSSAQNYLWEAQ